MADDLKNFVSNIEGFGEMKASAKIDVFAFFFQKIRLQEAFSASEISDSFAILRQVPYSNITQYLRKNSHKGGKRGKKIKFFENKEGFHLESNFEKELESQFSYTQEKDFLSFKVDESSLTWKPKDIPYLNNKIRNSAHFFTKLYFLFYHLENSLRKFLIKRLTSILGNNWEIEVLSNVDLTKAQSIRREVDLSEMLPNRGENILYYCMWDDYAKIINAHSNIFSSAKESNEIVAHLGTLTKIRNAIAHNVSTIPKGYQDELTVFLNKFVKLMKKNES